MNNRKKWLIKYAKSLAKTRTKEEVVFIILMIYSSINDSLYFDNLRYIAFLIYDLRTGNLRKPRKVNYEDLAIMLNMNTKTLLKNEKY